MKIVQIIPDDRDAFSRYDVEIPFFGPAPTALLEGFERLGDSVEVHVVSCVRHPLSAPEKVADNIFYHQVFIPGGYRRTLFIDAVRKVRRKIHEINPDIVHGQGTEDYPAVSAAFSGFPNLITIHGNMRAVAKKLRYRPFRYLAITLAGEVTALHKTDAVICSSDYTARCVGNLNQSKIRIPNAVRTPFFDLSWEPADPPRLLCVGHILSYKNQIGLIQALDGFAEKMGVRLVFAGKCQPMDAYQKLFLKMVSERAWCEYAGALDRTHLQQLLCTCAGVVHPTLEDNSPLAVAEAQAIGIPVAASAIGGVPDLIQHGETGLLFDPQDPESIREQVRILLDKATASRIASQAKQFARQKYYPESVARQHIECYQRILHPSRNL